MVVLLDGLKVERIYLGAEVLPHCSLIELIFI
jgi:hypothetical protein